MSDVKQYKTAAGKSPGELDSAVYALIAEGFQPYGTPYGEKETLFQAMISGEEPEEPEEGEGDPKPDQTLPPGGDTSGGTDPKPDNTLPAGRPAKPSNRPPGSKPSRPGHELPEHAAPKRG